jgi:galactoside O-acetyltransferase
MNAVLWENDDGSLVRDDSVKCFGKGTIKVGRNVRIDAFCVLTVGPEGIEIGDDVHLGVGVCIFGAAAKVKIGNGCSLSPRSTIYTACDDFRKRGLIGACNPREKRNVVEGPVLMEDGSALGHGAVLFPGSRLCRGAAAGTYAMVIGRVEEEMMVLNERNAIHMPRGVFQV